MKKNFLKGIVEIPLVSQPRQDSLYDQLLTVRDLANCSGCYDAADFLTTHIDSIEEKEKPRQTIAMCWKCDDKMVQPDMVDDRCTQVVGCKRLTKTQWEDGMKNGNQTNCPILP